MQPTAIFEQHPAVDRVSKSTQFTAISNSLNQSRRLHLHLEPKPDSTTFTVRRTIIMSIQ